MKELILEQLKLKEQGLRIFELEEIEEIQELNLNREQLKSLLEDLAEEGEIHEDNSYRWITGTTELTNENQLDNAEIIEEAESGGIKNLTNYYLSCLTAAGANDSESIWARNQFNTYDYFEVDEISDLNNQNWGENNSFQEALARNRQNKYLKRLYLAYPLRLFKGISRRTGEPFYKIEPVFIVPFEDDHQLNEIHSSLHKSVFKNFNEAGNLANEEIRNLQDDLKIGDPDIVPRLDELADRLYELRPDWDWIEKPNIENLSKEKMSESEIEGIHNKAAIILIDKSKYTLNLDRELNDLSKLELDSDNALANWISRSFHSLEEDQTLLQPLELNTEQREAVLSGLNNSLTVVTGPPGTGKSQVVTSLLVNAAYRGKRVLFASYNNKAVDVVHVRANGIADKEFLNRLGNAYERDLSSQLNKLISASGNQEEIEEKYQIVKKEFEDIEEKETNLKKDIEEVRKLRNKLDNTSRQLKRLREDVGESDFSKLESSKGNILKNLINLKEALKEADISNQGFFSRLLWDFIKTKKLEVLNARKIALKESLKGFKKINFNLDLDGKELSDWIKWFLEIVNSLDTKLTYKALLDELSNTNLTSSQQKLLEVQKEISSISAELWETHLNKLPFDITKEEHKAIGEVATLLELITNTREEGGRVHQEMRQYLKKFPIISKVLNAWAISSLSVRNRVPFESGFFDILVIDEASQCDIASALPLLYRAKNTVIIGDPNQLKHIPGINMRTDKLFMDQFQIIEGSVIWSYSRNSLYDLASKLCPPKNLIMLRDHHRSRKEIINFSNKHFYDGKLRIATNYSRLNLPPRKEPVVRWIDKKGKVEQVGGRGAFNVEEIKAVVSEINRLVVEQQYSGSIGVVSPFKKQAVRIQDAVESNTALSPYLARMEFLCNTVHSFQGDEKDIIIFSTVINKNCKKNLSDFVKKDPHLFNVAITRARCSLIVIGDKSYANSSDIKHLKAFSRYVDELALEAEEDLPVVSKSTNYPEVSNPEQVSNFEKDFYKLLYEAGIHPYVQYPVDWYKLDFALIQGERKLDIEIDGESYHRDWDQGRMRRDIIRNHRLIEDGWDIMRIWVYQLIEDPDFWIQKIKEWMEKE